MSSPHTARLCGVLLLVIIFTVLIRGGTLWLGLGGLENDPDGYRRLAENILAHGTFGNGDSPTAYRPPLYPLLLVPCVACEHPRAAIGIMHAAMGVATVGLVFYLGWLWGLGLSGAVLAAVLIACDPILLHQSTQVMTETPAALLVVAGLAALTWVGRRPTTGRIFLAGVVLALGALCRPTLLLWTIAVGAVWLWLNSRRLTAPGGIVGQLCLPVAFALGVLIELSPWAVRNQLQFGRPILTTTHGGYTLLLANNPDFYRWLHEGRWGDVWNAEAFNADWQRRKPTDELASDRLAYAEAQGNILRRPIDFCYACLVRCGRFWSPLPHRVLPEETPLRRTQRYVVAVWYLVEFLLAAIGLWQFKNNDECRKMNNGCPPSIHPSSFILHPSHCWLWGMLLVACLMAVHTVYWTDMRMRATAMPVVALTAAAGAIGYLRHKRLREYE